MFRTTIYCSVTFVDVIHINLTFFGAFVVSRQNQHLIAIDMFYLYSFCETCIRFQNFHPMLRTYSGAEDVKGDAIILAHRMEEILQQHPTVSLVLIPHDDRSRLSDNLMLSTIFDTLHKYHSRIFYSPEVPRAPQLKALCGLLDGLISSRMHLAIAAFGMEVPVMAATYQGKFEGLFLHFNLDDTFLLNPKRFLSHEIVETFASFLQAIPDLKKQFSERLPVVQQLSYKNLKDE